MALLVRLRQALLRSSSIPKCCSFSPIAPDSSQLVNLSKTPFPAASRLENPSIRPTPSKHDRPPPSTSLKNRFLSGPYCRQPETKLPKDEIDFPKFPNPSPEEMIETCFQTLPKVLGSAEDTKSIEEMFDKFKKSGLEMIAQLKGACMLEKRSVEDAKVIEELSDKLKKSGLEMIMQLKGDKCWNDVITRSLSSPPTEHKNQRSVEDMGMIDGMSEKSTNYVELLEKCKAMRGYASRSRDLYIHHKNKKPEDRIEKAKAPPRVPGECQLSEDILEGREMLFRFKDYVEMTETTDMQEKSRCNTFSPKEASFFASTVAHLKGNYGANWRSHVFTYNKYDRSAVDGDAHLDILRKEYAIEESTAHTAC